MIMLHGIGKVHRCHGINKGSMLLQCHTWKGRHISKSNFSCVSFLRTEEWMAQACEHYRQIDALIYPQERQQHIYSPKHGSGSDSPKRRPQGQQKNRDRVHLVSTHPIFNFIHSYYNFSVPALRLFSPGLGVRMECPNTATVEAFGILSQKYLVCEDNAWHYDSTLIGANIDGIGGATDATMYRNSGRDGSGSGIGSAAVITNARQKKALKQIEFLKHNLQVLRATAARSPFFGCFGMHEWAMLYNPAPFTTVVGRGHGHGGGHGGNVEVENAGTVTVGSGFKPRTTSTSGVYHHERKQKHLGLRLPQHEINEVVRNRRVRCSHFDAYRFFHPEAQALNYNPTWTTALTAQTATAADSGNGNRTGSACSGTCCSGSSADSVMSSEPLSAFVSAPNPNPNPAPRLTRSSQLTAEQPGCIHANMDLFKYAAELYPCVSSQTLIACLKLALHARAVDMRASPYEVSHIPECAEKIAVENAAGRVQYRAEQEALYRWAVPLRHQLIQDYTTALRHLQDSESL